MMLNWPLVSLLLSSSFLFAKIPGGDSVKNFLAWRSTKCRTQSQETFLIRKMFAHLICSASAVA